MKKGKEKNKLMKRVFILILFITLSCRTSKDSTVAVIDVNLINSIEKRLEIITKTDTPRNYKNVQTLNFVANYIKNELSKVCENSVYQNFTVNDTEYKNVIGSLGIEHKERIIIGAHYDVCGDSEGADDNASGVVGLLELAKKLSKEKLKYRIDFVAYSLEEPPFFRTEHMGSYIHAKDLYDKNIDIKGMLCLESIGYYSDKPNSQNFPIKEMSLKYGDKGDFITVVQNNNAEEFSNQVNVLMKQESLIKTASFKGDASLTGIDFSDHLNYWKFNYDATMITNTAFFRNKNYHTNGDVMKTLNLEKMSLVIEQVYQTIKKIE